MTPCSPVQQKFIVRRGEMETRRGIYRTVAPIHALLFISEKPPNAEDIVPALGVARSHLSQVRHCPTSTLTTLTKSPKAGNRFHKLMGLGG